MPRNSQTYAPLSAWSDRHAETRSFSPENQRKMLREMHHEAIDVTVELRRGNERFATWFRELEVMLIR